MCKERYIRLYSSEPTEDLYEYEDELNQRIGWAYAAADYKRVAQLYVELEALNYVLNERKA